MPPRPKNIWAGNPKSPSKTRQNHDRIRLAAVEEGLENLKPRKMEIYQIENPKCLLRGVYCSAVSSVRFAGASGGVISEIIHYLFETGKINTAVNYYFDKEKLYEPEFVYEYAKYHMTGSIYHEINLPQFLREHTKAIKGTLGVVCLPCQVVRIRKILASARIKSIVISLVCSGQQKKEATWRYLDYCGIEIKEVNSIRYRGLGWPSGITIVKANSEQIHDHIVGGRWGQFRKPPYSLERCMYCKDSFGCDADFTIGDPWLKKYVETEREGASLVGVLTTQGLSILGAMVLRGQLIKCEELSQNEFLFSQKQAILGKFVSRNSPKLYHRFYRTVNSPLYRKFILNNSIKTHAKLCSFFGRFARYWFRVKSLCHRVIA